MYSPTYITRQRERRNEYRLRTKPARVQRNETIRAAHEERDQLIRAVKAKCTEKVQLANLRYDSAREAVKSLLEEPERAALEAEPF